MKLALVVSDCAPTRALFHALKTQHEIVGVLFDAPVDRRKILRRRARRLGLSAVLSQALFRLSIQRHLEREGAARRAEIFRDAGCDTSPIAHPARLGPKSVNSREAREALRRWAPEAVVLHGTRIVGKRTLRCVDAPWINIHAGVTPSYRGVHGGWWALAEQRPEAFGATVHLVDEGIDTGGILRQPRVMPSPEDHFGTYPTLQFCAALEALLGVLDEGPPFVPTPAAEPQHTLRYHPTLGQYLRSRFMFGVR